MADLIYSTIASVDGYTADEDGDFSWAAPAEDLHRFINELERSVGTYLYGRRMYETMIYWETALEQDGPPSAGREFAEIWAAADKVVYSRSLGEVTSGRTRMEREFDPAAVRELKGAASADITVSGPDLAAQALAAGLVDELQLFQVPAIVGGGTRALPDGLRLLDLELTEERRFGDGTVFLRYRVGA